MLDDLRHAGVLGREPGEGRYLLTAQKGTS
jgi:hypothetical protein